MPFSALSYTNSLGLCVSLHIGREGASFDRDTGRGPRPAGEYVTHKELAIFLRE